MATSSVPTTMSEGLQRVNQDLAATLSTPDADIQFLTQLIGIVTGRMRQGSGQPMGQGQPQGAPGGQPGGQPGGPMGQGGPPPGGPPPQGPPPGGPGMMQGGPTPNGVTPLAQQPNTDELRRLIQSKAGA